MLTALLSLCAKLFDRRALIYGRHERVAQCEHPMQRMDMNCTAKYVVEAQRLRVTCAFQCDWLVILDELTTMIRRSESGTKVLASKLYSSVFSAGFKAALLSITASYVWNGSRCSTLSSPIASCC